MKNAKEEFLRAIEDETLICAKIGKEKSYDEKIWYILKPRFTKKAFKEFLNNIDFNYDSGFGCQQLYGIILFKDSYSDRGEYDGSEWWEYHKIPTTKQVLNYGDE